MEEKTIEKHNQLNNINNFIKMRNQSTMNKKGNIDNNTTARKMNKKTF